MKRPVLAPYSTPLVRACALPHHRPGRLVTFTEYDHSLRKIRRFTGRVVTHLVNGHQITIAIEPSGRHHTVECGAVAAAQP